ncbi:MAG: hypothetical protein QOJ64_1187 [Acidobacteriota bacterium]|jgi:hypothetical protein|nr:hypothetical protein [Acidobacteriota bacterium]
MKLISILTLILIIGSVTLCHAQVSGQPKTCTTGQTAPPIGSWTWAGESRVEVFIRVPDFSADEVPALLRAVKNWDGSYRENESGVRFDYKGTVSEARTCDGCLTIMRGIIADERHGAELRAFSKRMVQVIDYAQIVIDPRYKKPEILTAIVAHELGHSLGLLDCSGCKRGSTAMGRFNTTFKLLNIQIADRSSGIVGPLRCDLMQVRAAYSELRRVVGPAPSTDAGDATDDGEEPEEDDTPIVP